MEVEKELIEKILKSDINGVKDILFRHKLKPNTYDEHGMTPLQHAAYKGNKEVVQLLLDQGEDVNSGKHEFGYTALHFAALSGNVEVCQLLLEHGAKTHSTNSVGRTASQIAAFVGNHACVTMINNFVPKSDVDYYTVPSGFETEPKLPPHASVPLYKFIMEANLHPVKIAFNLIRLPLLFENIEKIKNVLDLMSEKEMKRGLETSEIMSFKFHYLGGILEEIIKIKESLKEKRSMSSDKNPIRKPTEPIELFITRMLRSTDGMVEEYQENTLKLIVKKFHNRQCAIFRQMVSTLSAEDSCSALSVITSVINGQRGFIDSDVTACATCGEEKANRKCSRCKSTYYCDRDCQRYHWFVHKKHCSRLADIQTSINDSENKSKNNSVDEGTAAALKSAVENLRIS